ncbi:hypothetical protein EVAR_98008_1 [Eumeta japonica]|uniref:Uncharacterized protein n=1 Tax=Eumeta variegata TaxID=151549 RepID=A0A4C1WM47_EUMVA|nr:hypothetical protein EVAR_98008_1 [Eumeta japonica]
MKLMLDNTTFSGTLNSQNDSFNSTFALESELDNIFFQPEPILITLYVPVILLSLAANVLLIVVTVKYNYSRNVDNGRQPTVSAEKRYIIKLNDVHNQMLYKEIKAVQANMLEEMLRAQAASAMEHCALPNRRLRIQISDIHSCGGEKKDPRTTIDTCHR